MISNVHWVNQNWPDIVWSMKWEMCEKHKSSNWLWQWLQFNWNVAHFTMTRSVIGTEFCSMKYDLNVGGLYIHIVYPSELLTCWCYVISVISIASAWIFQISICLQFTISLHFLHLSFSFCVSALAFNVAFNTIALHS